MTDEKVVFVLDDVRIGSVSDVSLLPCEGEKIRIHATVLDDDIDLDDGVFYNGALWCEVESVWWAVYDHGIVAEVYVEIHEQG